MGSNLGPPFFGADLATLSGTNFKTLAKIIVRPPNRLDVRRGDWVDGQPVGQEKTKAGDDTVLAASSQLGGADNFFINQNHGDLIASSEGIGKIFEFLGLNVTPLSPYTEPKSTLIVIAWPGESELIGPKGQVEKNARGMISLFEPSKGNYQVRIKPAKETTFIGVGQLIGDQFFWQEYHLKGKGTRQGKIWFDPQRPKENPLSF